MKNTLWLIIPAFLTLLSCSKENGPPDANNSAPQITALVLYGDTLHIVGNLGPAPAVGLRRVIINEETISEENIVKWEEDKIEVKVEKKAPDEKKVQVETEKKKSNVKIINIPSIPVSSIVKVSFLQVKEPSSFLYIYGSFGTDPGVARRSIRIWQFTNREVYTNIHNIISWTPNLIICQIPDEGEGSCGKVIVKIDQDSSFRNLYYYEGVLDYKRPQGGANGTLAEKIQFHIRLRGEGVKPTENVQLLDLNTNLHVESYAKWEGSGQASSSYNNVDGCATINVTWATATGTSYAGLNTNTSDGRRWTAYVKHRTDGFDLKIKFQADNVISSNVSTVSCSGGANESPRKESIYFDEFDEKVIPLRFTNASIGAGELTKTGLTSTAGLAWDVNEFPLHFMTAYLKWGTIHGWLE